MEKKVKVLIVHNYYQVPGGEDTVVANEKKLLEDHGHKVLLYSRNNSELKAFSKLQKLMLPITTVFNPKTYREIKRIIRENEVDIVHVHNTLNLISPSVYYAAFSCKVPIVQTIHNFRLLCPGATFYRAGYICEDCVSKGLGCAVKHGCYRGSKIQTLACVISTWIHRGLGTYKKLNYICLTEFNKKKLLELKGIRESHVFVKPNFVFGSGQEPLVEAKKDHFIYVGRLDELKGVKLLFEAWKRMNTSAPKLLVCGTGPLEDWCKRFVQENPECDVELKGFVANKEARKLITNAKALILPTQWYEGFPMTIVEAYSVGTPVIGSNIGNVGDLIQDGVNGYKFQYNDVESLIDAVHRFEQTQKDWKSVVYDMYERKCSPGNNAIVLSNIYQEIRKMEVIKNTPKKYGGGGKEKP